MLLLARELGRQGFLDLDLTPWGDYKNRFADHAETVYLLEVYFNRAAYLRRLLRNAAKNKAIALLQACGIDRNGLPRRILLDVHELVMGGVGSLWARIIRSVLRMLYERQETRVYVIDRAHAPTSPSSGSVNRNSLSDLLKYSPVGIGSKSVARFLRDAETRFEAGGGSYTRTEHGSLVHCAWLTKHTSRKDAGMDIEHDYAPGSYLMWDDFTHTPPERELERDSMSLRVLDAFAMPDVQKVFMHVAGDNSVLRRSVEQMGFQYCGSEIKLRFLGSRRRKWIPALPQQQEGISAPKEGLNK